MVESPKLRRLFEEIFETDEVDTYHRKCASPLVRGESVIKCPCPLNVLKDAYDHSCD